MENKGSIIFKLEKEKSLKILLSEFPGSYKKLSLIALEDQREIPLVTSNGIDFEDVLVFFNTHPHILFDLSNSSGNQFNSPMKKKVTKNLADTYSTYMRIIKNYLMNTIPSSILAVGLFQQRS